MTKIFSLTSYLVFGLNFLALIWPPLIVAEENAHSEAKTETPKPRPKCETLPDKTRAELWALVDCYYTSEQYDKTLEKLKVLSRQNDPDLEAFFTASWLLWKQGQELGGSSEKKKNLDALEELQRARVSKPTHWEVYTELGDFYYLRVKPMAADKAYTEYLKAREYYDGDYSHKVPKASLGRKASIENRIARAAEVMGRKGEAVEASCRALFFDPDDEGAKARIEKLGGSCVKKNVKSPLSKADTKPSN